MGRTERRAPMRKSAVHDKASRKAGDQKDYANIFRKESSNVTSNKYNGKRITNI